EEEKEREEALETKEPESKTEEPGIELEKPAQEIEEPQSKAPEKLNGVEKETELSGGRKGELAVKQAEEHMTQIRQVMNEPTRILAEQLAEITRQQKEMIASVSDNMKLIRGLPESESVKFNQVSRALESMRFIRTDNLKHVFDAGNYLAESLRAIQPDLKPI